MGNTRGPCKCKWCDRQAVPRPGSVQLCERCQAGVLRVARAAYEVQSTEGMSDGAMGRMLTMAPGTWSKIRKTLEKNLYAPLVTGVIDPNHPLGKPAAPKPASTEGRTDGGPWQHRAVCRGAKEADLLFFPDSERDRALIPVTVKTYCDRCPVYTQCRKTRASEGLWGGVYYKPRHAK